MQVPSYVRYKSLPYVLVESDGSKGKILDPATQKKLHVNLSNLTLCKTEHPEVVSTRFGDFFITPKGTIISTVTFRNVHRTASPARTEILCEYYNQKRNKAVENENY